MLKPLFGLLGWITRKIAKFILWIVISLYLFFFSIYSFLYFFSLDFEKAVEKTFETVENVTIEKTFENMNENLTEEAKEEIAREVKEKTREMFSRIKKLLAGMKFVLGFFFPALIVAVLLSFVAGYLQIFNWKKTLISLVVNILMIALLSVLFNGMFGGGIEAKAVFSSLQDVFSSTVGKWIFLQMSLAITTGIGEGVKRLQKKKRN